MPSWRPWCIAAVEAGVGLGLADAVIAGGWQSGVLDGRGPLLAFAGSLAGLAALGVVVLTMALYALWRLAARLRPSQRPMAAQIVGIAAGLVAGFALFSGTAMQRSPARPWAILATAALAALATQLAWSGRHRGLDFVSRHPVAIRAGLLAASVLLYLGHAFVYARLYPGLHAIAAAAAVSALVIALGGSTSDAPHGAGLALVVALVGGALGGWDLTRSAARRALARQHAPITGYLVGVLGRIAPSMRVVAVVRDERLSADRHFDLRGLDLVLVTVDALRADRLGVYDGPAGLTPHFDALAREGLVFDRAYCTTPHTSYSLASLMTAKYFRQLSLLGLSTAHHETLAASLARAGFATAGFYPPAVFSVDGEQLGELKSSGFDFAYRREGYLSAAERVAQVEAFLDQIPVSRRVFIWVHFFEPHEPYEAHDGTRGFGQSPQALYNGEVRVVDAGLGALRAAIARRHRRAAWVVTADHGEEFGEHGGRYHGTALYDEQARVPLLIAAPGLPVARLAGPVSQIDLMPTLLAGFGVPRPPRLRGRDLGPLAYGEPWPHAIFASTGSSRMIVAAADKLLCDVHDGTCELYDLLRDPGERANLIDRRPERGRELRALLEGWQGSQGRYEARGAGGAQAALDLLDRAEQGEVGLAPAVAALLEHGDGSLGERAARALARLGDRQPTVLDALARYQARSAGPAAREAGLALAQLGDDRGRQHARAALAADDLSVTRRAALGLARLGSSEGASVLATLARDVHASDLERDAAVAALAQLDDPALLPTWLALLEDLRLAPRAAEALGSIGDPRATASLQATAERTPYALTRRAALGSLATLDPSDAARRLGPALGRSEPLPEAFDLAHRLGEPGRRLAGSLVQRGLVAGRPTTVSLRGRPPRGAAWVILRVRASAPTSVRIDGGAAPAVVPAGTSESRVLVDRSIRGPLRVRSEAAVDLLGVIVVPSVP